MTSCPPEMHLFQRSSPNPHLKSRSYPSICYMDIKHYNTSPLTTSLIAFVKNMTPHLLPYIFVLRMLRVTSSFLKSIYNPYPCLTH